MGIKVMEREGGSECENGCVRAGGGGEVMVESVGFWEGGCDLDYLGSWGWRTGRMRMLYRDCFLLQNRRRCGERCSRNTGLAS